MGTPFSTLTNRKASGTDVLPELLKGIITSHPDMPLRIYKSCWWRPLKDHELVCVSIVKGSGGRTGIMQAPLDQAGYIHYQHRNRRFIGPGPYVYWPSSTWKTLPISSDGTKRWVRQSESSRFPTISSMYSAITWMTASYCMISTIDHRRRIDVWSRSGLDPGCRYLKCLL